MHWIINTKLIVETLQSLVSIVERATVTPITGNVKLSVSGNQMRLVTTDTRLQIQALLALEQSQVSDDVHTTVSAQKLLDSCSSCKDETISFNLSDKQLSVRFSDGRFNLHTMPAEDFPELQRDEASSHLCLAQRTWRKLIRSSLYAVSDRNHRMSLKGLLLQIDENKVRVVGTDGHRLSIAEAPIEQSALQGEPFNQAILPRKSVMEMQRLFVDSDDELTLSFSGRSHVSFQLEHNHITFTSNLVEETYPDFKHVIPNNNDKQIIMNRQELIDKLSSVVVIQKELPRTVLITADEDKVHVCCKNFEGEDAELSLAAHYKGQQMQMGFNEKYLKEALLALSFDEVCIKVGEPAAGVLIEELSDIHQRCVIMPLTI